MAAAVLAGLALCAGSVAAAQAPDPVARALARDLARVEVALDDLGYALAAGPFSGRLARGEAQRITLTMRAGQDYRIVGVCAEPCGGVTLSLRDPRDALVARSFDDVGAAVMHVRPAFTGAHAVDVEAPRCGAAPCWYAVNVYAR